MMASDDDGEASSSTKQPAKSKSRQKPPTPRTSNSFSPLPIEEYSNADDNEYIHSGSGSLTSSSDSDIQEITNEEVKLFRKISYPLLILFLISLPTVLPPRLLLNVVQQLASTAQRVRRTKSEKQTTTPLAPRVPNLAQRRHALRMQKTLASHRHHSTQVLPQHRRQKCRIFL